MVPFAEQDYGMFTDVWNQVDLNDLELQNAVAHLPLHATTLQQAQALAETFASTHEATFLSQWVGNLFQLRPDQLIAHTNKLNRLLDPQAQAVPEQYRAIFEQIARNAKNILKGSLLNSSPLESCFMEGLKDSKRPDDFTTLEQLSDFARVYTLVVTHKIKNSEVNLGLLDQAVKHYRDRVEQRLALPLQGLDTIEEAEQVVTVGKQVLSRLDDLSGEEEGSSVIQGLLEDEVISKLMPFKFGIDAIDGETAKNSLIHMIENKLPTDALNFSPGQLCIVAGQSGVGKTQFVVAGMAAYLKQIAKDLQQCQTEEQKQNKLKETRPYIFFSFEMTKSAVWKRLIRSIVASHAWFYITGNFWPKGIEKNDDFALLEYLHRKHPWVFKKIVVLDSIKLKNEINAEKIASTIEDQVLKFLQTERVEQHVVPHAYDQPLKNGKYVAIKQVAVKFPVPPAQCVSIDYMQLFNDGTDAMRHEQITKAVNLLQEVAKRRKVRILLLSQITNGEEPKDMFNLLAKEAVADAKSPVRNADLVLTIQQLPHEMIMRVPPNGCRFSDLKPTFPALLRMIDQSFLPMTELSDFTYARKDLVHPFMHDGMRDYLGYSTFNSAGNLVALPEDEANARDKAEQEAEQEALGNQGTKKPHFTQTPPNPAHNGQAKLKLYMANPRLYGSSGKRIFINVAKNRNGQFDRKFTCLLDGRNSHFSLAIEYDKETLSNPFNYNQQGQ